MSGHSISPSCLQRLTSTSSRRDARLPFSNRFRSGRRGIDDSGSSLALEGPGCSLGAVDDGLLATLPAMVGRERSALLLGWVSLVLLSTVLHLLIACRPSSILTAVNPSNAKAVAVFITLGECRSYPPSHQCLTFLPRSQFCHDLARRLPHRRKSLFLGVLPSLIRFALQRLGRRSLILVSMISMSASAVVLGYSINNSQFLLASTCIVLFIASFSVGLGPIPFVLMGEVPPIHVGTTFFTLEVGQHLLTHPPSQARSATASAALVRCLEGLAHMRRALTHLVYRTGSELDLQLLRSRSSSLAERAPNAGSCSSLTLSSRRA